MILFPEVVTLVVRVLKDVLGGDWVPDIGSGCVGSNGTWVWWPVWEMFFS